MAVEGELVRPYRFGRPSKLTKQLLQKAWDYVEQSDNMNVTTLLPTRERLALTLGINRDTLYQWESENTDFSDICKTLDMMQADKTIQNSLIGMYAPGTAAIILSKHGYVKQEQVDNRHEMVNPILGGASVHGDDKHTQAIEADE